jgi:hypothetical protein
MNRDKYSKEVEKIAPNAFGKFIDFLCEYLPNDFGVYGQELFDQFFLLPIEMKTGAYLKFLNENDLLLDLLPDLSKDILEGFKKLEFKC